MTQEEKVTLKGWVDDIKDFGGVQFITLRDKTKYTQVTVTRESPVAQAIKGLTKESVIEVTGKFVANEKAAQGKEIIPDAITVLARSESQTPIAVAKADVGLDARLKWRPLALRSPQSQAIFKIQSTILASLQETLYHKGFQQIFTPCLLGVASEGGSEIFSVLYFDQEAYLRQDPQLHRQLTIASGLTKVFEIGPAFRAEQSHTSRHLCEHRVCAVEQAFIKDEQDVIRLQEELIIAMIKQVVKDCSSELKILGATLEVPTSPFPQFTFEQVQELLEEEGILLEDDLDTKAEKALYQHVKKKYGSDFYFVTQFPKKPFYVMQEGSVTRSVDLYFRELELSSGGQREHRHEELVESAMSVGDLAWFTEHFKFGVPPHGGFALGIERLTMILTDAQNIKECVLFPRDPERLIP